MFQYCCISGEICTLSRVLRFTPDDITVTKFPLFKHGIFIILDSEDWGHLLKSLSAPVPHDSPFR